MVKKNSVDPVRPLTAAEKKLVETIDKTWTREQALNELQTSLQVAIEIELATLPIYLYTYYSIDRTPQGFPDTPISRYADKAGSVIMSVAVEEMLHMSLSSNVLFSLGKLPQLYLNSPGPFPSNLPGHTKLGPDKKPVALPLAKFSEEQLWQFLEIEYPAASDAPPQGGNWYTIGQIYSYVRCIIFSKHITDDDFKQGAKLRQIQPGNYSPNSIDTVYPSGSFDYKTPVPAPEKGSAAGVANFSSREDSHAGRFELITVDSKQSALQAIQTIDAQGEGFGPSKFDDPSHQEYSHYFKFLTLQSHLQGYADGKNEKLPAIPKPPAAQKQPFSANDLRSIVFDFPTNPVASAYPSGRRDVANLVSGLYQYMLIMTESIFLQPPEKQKLYFNQSLHRSMIWILDKIIRAMRAVNLNDGATSTSSYRLAPTFENIDLGTRDIAFATLNAMCNNLNANYGNAGWYTADLQYYVNLIPSLPDVSDLWKPHQRAPSTAKFKGVPKFPATPPKHVGENEVRHACMGLNHCSGQGRTRDNACAGQGYCSTALEYNFANPSQPLITDHTCHVKNACAGQGGCGLYGTAEEQNHPGANKCGNLGSCATPINAERFSTDGPNRGKSVWLRAREVFATQTWPKLREENPKLPKAPPQLSHPELFQYGPTMEWIETYSDEGMTACGASGMSGAHSCA